MEGIIRYCIVKKYVGVNKKSPKNTHLFFVPVDPKKYLYLALIGKMSEEDEDQNNYAAQLLVRLPEEIIDDTIQGEIEYFKNRFVEVESLPCKSSNPSPGKYVINIAKKGFNIKSDIEITYQIEYSTNEKRIYLLNADLTLATEDITEDDMKMVAAKQVAFMGGRKRFKEMKEFSKLRRSKYYHD
jgi:hypothetical protein